MEASPSLFLPKPTSLSNLKPPLPLCFPLKRFVSISKLQTQAQSRNFGALYGKRNGFSFSTAVATESATVSQNDTAQETQKEEKEKIVLPTNESSEKLLRIRHTVNFLCSFSFYPNFCC